MSPGWKRGRNRGHVLAWSRATSSPSSSTRSSHLSAQGGPERCCWKGSRGRCHGDVSKGGQVAWMVQMRQERIFVVIIFVEVLVVSDNDCFFVEILHEDLINRCGPAGAPKLLLPGRLEVWNDWEQIRRGENREGGQEGVVRGWKLVLNEVRGLETENR